MRFSRCFDMPNLYTERTGVFKLEAPVESPLQISRYKYSYTFSYSYSHSDCNSQSWLTPPSLSLPQATPLNCKQLPLSFSHLPSVLPLRRVGQRLWCTRTSQSLGRKRRKLSFCNSSRKFSFNASIALPAGCVCHKDKKVAICTPAKYK